ncbi:MAG TPA: hypothetical protein VGM38_02520 [Pseudolysinimonas sp.]|jgi:hypothetical protein
MTPIAERVIATLVFCLIVTAAMAQNVDFDASMQGWSAIAYGTGAKILIGSIMGYLMYYGLAHQHLWVSLCGVLGAVAYFSVGVLMGRMKIV